MGVVLLGGVGAKDWYGLKSLVQRKFKRLRNLYRRRWRGRIAALTSLSYTRFIHPDSINVNFYVGIPIKSQPVNSKFLCKSESFEFIVNYLRLVNPLKYDFFPCGFKVYLIGRT